MAAYTIKRFGGSAPRIADHLLGDSVAALARDCKFWHGTLDAWRQPRLIREVGEGVQTVFLHDQCWLDFDTCVDIAQGPVTCRELYTTGDQEWPAIVTFDPATCIPTIRRLGVPCGDTAPVATVGAVGTTAPKDTEGRAYAYQYMNERSEFGSLSKSSPVVTVRDGQPVTLSGWAVPEASWGVTHVRLFRSVSGHQTGREPGNVFDTVWMHIADVPMPGPLSVSGASLLSVSSPKKSSSCSTPKMTFEPQNSSSSLRKSDLAICGVIEQI